MEASLGAAAGAERGVEVVSEVHQEVAEVSRPVDVVAAEAVSAQEVVASVVAAAHPEVVEGEADAVSAGRLVGYNVGKWALARRSRACKCANGFALGSGIHYEYRSRIVRMKTRSHSTTLLVKRATQVQRTIEG